MNFSCINQEILENERVHCGTCGRDFAIYTIKHICDENFTCTSYKKLKYEEKYLADSVEMYSAAEDVKQSQCLSCEIKCRQSVEARKCTCPQCGYTGCYICDESKLCPACTAPPTHGIRRT